MARAQRVTIDEKFNAEYSKKGLQPFVSRDGRIRSVKIKQKSNVVGEAEKSESPSYRTSRTTAQISNQPKRIERPSTPQTVGTNKTIQVKQKKKKAGLKSRLKATAVNSSIMSWLIPSYIFIQIPFALLSIVFFGISYVFTSLRGDSTTELNADSGVLEVITTILWRGVAFAANTINEGIRLLTGYDFLGYVEEFPQKAFILTVGVLMAYGILVLLTMGLLYMFAGLKPLSGNGGTAKVITFLLCVIGYVMPVLNLFPWAIFWANMVWLKPK